MQGKLAQLMDIVQHDPAVQQRGRIHRARAVAGGGGIRPTRGRSIASSLKPLSQRAGNIDQVMAGLRRELAVVPGARLFLIPIQDLRVGGRQSNAAYQYTLAGRQHCRAYEWAPKLVAALEHRPGPDATSIPISSRKVWKPIC